MHRERGGAQRTVLTTEQLDRAVTAHASHFDRRDAIQAVANSLPNGAPARVEALEAADAFLRSPSVLQISEPPRAPTLPPDHLEVLEPGGAAPCRW